MKCNQASHVLRCQRQRKRDGPGVGGVVLQEMRGTVRLEEKESYERSLR